jgi:hypothetical protein
LRIWPWSKIADLEAELDLAVEHICFLEDVIDDNQQTCQQAQIIVSMTKPGRISFPNGIGEA